MRNIRGHSELFFAVPCESLETFAKVSQGSCALFFFFLCVMSMGTGCFYETLILYLLLALIDIAAAYISYSCIFFLMMHL